MLSVSPDRRALKAMPQRPMLPELQLHPAWPRSEVGLGLGNCTRHVELSLAKCEWKHKFRE